MLSSLVFLFLFDFTSGVHIQSFQGSLNQPASDTASSLLEAPESENQNVKSQSSFWLLTTPCSFIYSGLYSCFIGLFGTAMSGVTKTVDIASRSGTSCSSRWASYWGETCGLSPEVEIRCRGCATAAYSSLLLLFTALGLGMIVVSQKRYPNPVLGCCGALILENVYYLRKKVISF